jgi:hypothetical protein
MVLDPPKAGEPTRDRIRKLFAEALATALDAAAGVFGDPSAVAVEVGASVRRWAVVGG